MSVEPNRITLAPVKALDRGKLVSAEEAASLIRDGDTVATGGFVGIGFPEEIAIEIEKLYLAKEEHPVPTGKHRVLSDFEYASHERMVHEARGWRQAAARRAVAASEGRGRGR